MKRPFHDDQGRPCGCCEGVEKLTPMTTANRPGLDALAYRVGTQAAFLETMKARLSSKDYPALRALSVRESSDPSIALLDAGATMLDVLTFYQERIANEGYLRTATERRSILELARLVGYRLRPGVAASVYLAFTLEQGYETEIPAGTRAQSIPAPGELPQSFETSEPFHARAVWNVIKPRLGKPHFIRHTTDTLFFKGIDLDLNPNDPLLVIDSFGERHFRRILSAEVDAAADRTKVTLTIKGDVDLDVAELEMMIQRSEIPEEEGPYSVKIGDHAVEEIRAVTESLTVRLKDEGQPPHLLKYVIRREIPRLEQAYRVVTALNLDVLGAWFNEIYQKLEAILRQLDLRVDEPGTLGIELQDPAGLAQDILDHVEHPPPPPHRKPFSIEIGGSELQAVMASMGALVKVLQNPDIAADEQVLAVEAETLRLEQLEYVFDELGFDEPESGVPLVGWVRDLHVLLRNALPDGPLPPPVPTPFEAPSILPISALIGPLLKPPSLPPASARRLERPVDRIYSPKAIIAPQILSTFYPALRPTFYPAWRSVTVQPGPAKVYALRTTVSLFGHNVPRQVKYLQNGHPDIPENWVEWTPAEDEAKDVIYLDNANEKITPGSFVVIQKPDGSAPQIFGNIDVLIRPRFAYGRSAKTTEVKLPVGENEEGWWNPNPELREDFKFIRGTVVYAQSELFPMAVEPIDADVAGDTIEVDDLYGGLDTGRWLIVSGERTDVPGPSGVRAEELAMLAGIEEDVHRIELPDGTIVDLPGDTPHSRLKLAASLAYTYKRDTVTIHGNVVKATHGETREEVLGNGDGSQALQTFALKQAPLTYTSAPTPSGIESTLEVRVNDVRWPEVEGLVWLGANERGYITKTDNEDKTSVIFGDGEHGARLPTGAENITAVYRNGIGAAGNVVAEQISLLATKPLGVKSVINPLPASGGADRERRDQARRNAPLAVMALDRLVSVQDYADFARTFAGIGKASAKRLSDGRRQVVHVTIAGADDIPIDETSDLYHNLRRALHQFGDPFQAIKVTVRQVKLLVIVARVRLLPDFQWESVEPDIRACLLETLGFERRALGQDVVRSEVISTIQGVEGVAYVDLDVFDAVDEGADLSDLSSLADTLTLRRRVISETDRVDPEITDPPRPILPAQLAYLSPEIPDTLILSELP
jgi:hypothetical protein